jgi:hypothetical protein
MTGKQDVSVGKIKWLYISTLKAGFLTLRGKGCSKPIWCRGIS